MLIEERGKKRLGASTAFERNNGTSEAGGVQKWDGNVRIRTGQYARGGGEKGKKIHTPGTAWGEVRGRHLPKNSIKMF